MDKKTFDFKDFLKKHYRRIILYVVNIVAYALFMAWAMKVYRHEGGHGYEEMGQIVPYTMKYIWFAFATLVVYYLSIIASALNRAYKQKKEQKEQEEKDK
ncbi:MAG: hypothetical protein K2I30_06780 [Clostridia bacterium]|nr:hypothetical protein [Clostridia bacterium]